MDGKKGEHGAASELFSIAMEMCFLLETDRKTIFLIEIKTKKKVSLQFHFQTHYYELSILIKRACRELRC